MTKNINCESLLKDVSKLQSEKKFIEAIELLHNLSENDNSIAQNELAYMYFFGCDVKVDRDLANYWWEKSAHLGYPDSQFQLGMSLLEFGDIKQAIKWFKTASKKDHQEALYTLAKIYYKGNKVEKNIELAIKYYEKASILGHPNASTDLVIVINKTYGKFQAMKKLFSILFMRNLDFTNWKHKQ